ncbi:hypothetical protein MSBR3_3269 [Methanosarcina barkeri 3]|uniref:Uncharacterized protein n=1 Tax=Methanosarcina barkeri 3 TaxID=1434107 RepID=A0A0E3SPU8_METBA|nr:hypothetical protein [Methanosarcina barkeri]AKB83847.1 hypothetical protein MSBR3_3269 [Methanosarcina barkeri 3]
MSDHNFNSNLESIRDKAEKLNSEFIGHIKLSFRLQEIKMLSAVTSVPTDELIKAADGNKQTSERKATFLQKVERKRPGYSQATIIY